MVVDFQRRQSFLASGFLKNPQKSTHIINNKSSKLNKKNIYCRAEINKVICRHTYLVSILSISDGKWHFIFFILQLYSQV